MENNYKIGDKVKIKTYLQAGEIYGHCFLLNGMKKYRGKETTIINIEKLDFDVYIETTYSLNIDGGFYAWSKEMIIPAN